MFDIGLGEILLLAALGLLVFGPERLPKATADATKMMRNLRAMASNARKDLGDVAGVDLSDAKDAFREISSLHPKNLVAGIFDDEPAPPSETAKPTKPANRDGSAAGQPASEGTTSPARFDPDAT